MGAHITRMLFALHTPCSNFCKDDLMMVDLLKLVVKVKIKIKTHIVVCSLRPELFVSIENTFHDSETMISRNLYNYNDFRTTIIKPKSLHIWHNGNNLLPCRYTQSEYRTAKGWEVYYEALTHCTQPLKMYGVKFSLSTPGRHIGGEEVQHHSFFTLALDGGEWLTSCPSCHTYSKEQSFLRRQLVLS